MTKKNLLCLLIIYTIWTFSPFNLISSGYASEDKTGRFYVEVIDSSVSYKKSADSPWIAFTGSQDIDVGYFINVGPKGCALLHYPDGSTIRILEKSMVKIKSMNNPVPVRDYRVRFLGHIISSLKENNEESSLFITDSPIIRLRVKNMDYTAQCDPNLYLNVSAEADVEDVSISMGYNVTGKVKEISPDNQTFKLQVDKDHIITVTVHPHTVIYNGYEKYSKSGNPSDLGSIRDIITGEKVLVFAEDPVIIPRDMAQYNDASINKPPEILATYIGRDEMLPKIICDVEADNDVMTMTKSSIFSGVKSY